MLVSLWYKRVISRTIFSSLDKCEWEASVARHPASEWNFLDPHYIKCISTYVAVHINVKFMTSLMIIHAFNSFTYFFYIYLNSIQKSAYIYHISIYNVIFPNFGSVSVKLPSVFFVQACIWIHNKHTKIKRCLVFNGLHSFNNYPY